MEGDTRIAKREYWGLRPQYYVISAKREYWGLRPQYSVISAPGIPLHVQKPLKLLKLFKLDQKTLTTGLSYVIWRGSIIYPEMYKF